MNPNEKLTQLLTDKFFKHEGDDYAFMSCKTVGSNLMILTNKKTIQIPVDRFVSFYEKVESNCYAAGDVIKKEFVPTNLPVKKPDGETLPTEFKPRDSVIVIPESPKVFDKLNNSFESLIDAIDNASEADLKNLEIKAKMLTSVAQTAINMENSRNSLIRIISGK
jgi:hypothetical protein